MVILCVIALVLVEAYAWTSYKDMICPAVIHNIFWIVSIIGVLTFENDVISNKLGLLLILLGSVIFQFGFYISIRTSMHNTIPVNYRIEVRPSSLKWLIIILLITALPVIVQYYQYLKSSNIPLYDLLKHADDELHLPGLFNYYRKIVQFITLAILSIYWKLDKTKKQSISKYVLILFILSVLCVISIPTRNGILWFLLPLFILYCTIHSVSNKRILTVGLIAIFAFLLLFYFISLGKYWYRYDKGANNLDVLGKEIQLYLSGSIPAFCNNMLENDSIYYGKNTFRILFAISDKVFGTNSAFKLTNEFVNLGNGMTTNVFTFYDFYLRDFGIIYTLFAQFVVSCIHGVSYKWMKRGQLYNSYIFALLSYPLVMQFFQDQYASMLSTWLQIIFTGLIIFKSKLFVEEIPEYN